MYYIINKEHIVHAIPRGADRMVRPTVLIIEDELRLAENIQTYLKRYGFYVSVSDSGLEGLAEFARFKPGVVLLDFKLPDLDGIDVLRQLLSIDSQVKVIMMSGVGSERVAVSAMNSGAYDYLVKPLSLKELRELLDKAREE
jgi:DNA-binding response OmpR family regulator